ncbi:MAG: hypothetical protein NZ556_07755 [Fimbriimonadales bacterium]|nr:hypothetical protein [Fimbriimonadales bacterium]
MQRRLASLGIAIAVALGATLLIRAVADNFDPADKICAQNLARIGHALIMYVQDYDERLPLAYEQNAPNQPWRWNEPAPVPPNWQGGAPRDALTWANSLAPYIASFRVRRHYANFLHCPATLPAKQPSVDYSQRAASPAPISYTYNGYLHSYIWGIIENRESVPAIWEGLGREHLMGFAPVNPLLRCDRTDCLFTPCENPANHYPRGEVRLPRQSVWIHRTGLRFVMLDGSLQTRRLGRRLAPNRTNPTQDPFDLYNAHGVPAAAHTDACGYLPLFAPN